MGDAATALSECHAEIARLNKIIRVLMDRIERSSSARGSDYDAFCLTVVLEDQIRKRTEELEAALLENEAVHLALRHSEAKFRSLANQSMVGIAIIELGRFTYTNPKFHELFGYSTDELQNLTLLDLVVPSDRSRVAEQMRLRLSGEVDRVIYEYRALRKDGVQVDINVHGSVMDINGRRALIGLALDVTEKNRAQREMETLQQRLLEQSTHDSLTGLYNRRFLEEHLDRDLLRALPLEHSVSVIMSDIDHFKTVNDKYGHLAGDEVLRMTGDLMKRYSRESDTCFRYGGEEFLMVLANTTEAVARERAEQLRKAVAAHPVRFGSASIAVTASFGVATCCCRGAIARELIAAADRALYVAKKTGRNRVCSDSDGAAASNCQPTHCCSQGEAVQTTGIKVSEGDLLQLGRCSSDRSTPHLAPAENALDVCPAP